MLRTLLSVAAAQIVSGKILFPVAAFTYYVLRSILYGHCRSAWSVMRVHTQQAFEFKARESLSRVPTCITLLVLLIVGLASTAQLGAAQPAAALTPVKAGRLLGPRTGNVFAPAQCRDLR